MEHGRDVDRLTALHEAAHWVAGYRLNGCTSVDCLTIVADGQGRLGYTSTEVPWNEQGYRNEVIVLFAGWAAHLHEAPHDTEGAEVGAEDDFKTAVRYMDCCGCDEATARRSAADFVAENWAVIAALAVQALEYGALDESECTITVEIADGKADPSALDCYRHTWGARLEQWRLEVPGMQKWRSLRSGRR